jgi:hypothetical protein
MVEPYQEPVYQEEEYYYEPEPKRGMSGWVIALIVILVLILICCICGCLGMLLAGPAVSGVFEEIVTTMEALTPVP